MKLPSVLVKAVLMEIMELFVLMVLVKIIGKVIPSTVDMCL